MDIILALPLNFLRVLILLGAAAGIIWIVGATANLFVKRKGK